MMLTTSELRVGDRFTVGGVMRTVVQTEAHEDGYVSVHYRPSVGLMHVKPTIKIEEVDTSGRTDDVCPTCDGDSAADWSVGLGPCPDCTDGKVHR